MLQLIKYSLLVLT